jgi:precorrin-2/cobalt-factor-2 C20-methyltransferase
MMAQAGRLFGLGVGPGDPDLITVKALRLLQTAPVVAYHAAKGKKSNALGIVERYLGPAQIAVPLVYPVTTEKLPPPLCYERIISDFYDTASATLAAHLDAGRDVAVICEGDPLFYGSFMYLHDRLAARYATEVVPGVCSVVAAAAVLGAPLAYRNQTLTVLSGVLEAAELKQRLAATDAAAIMKLGSNLAKVRRVIDELGLGDRALYVERATMTTERILKLAEVDPDTSPYFSIILVPGLKWTGR